MSEIERELESELHRVLDPITGLPIPPRRSPRHGTASRALLGGAGAALSFKLLTGVAVAAAAVTVAGAAATGTFDPATWGQQVSQHVADCKAALSDGQHGIGDCVSAFASQHGVAVSSAARHHGNDNGNGQGSSNGNANNGNGNGNGHGKDKAKDHPTPKAGSGSNPTDTEPVDPVGGRPAVTITPLP